MSSRPIDLRSDTVTRPSPGMRAAMADAEVGDDVLGDDPTTRSLEERVAELLGHETALFFPSGTQANQVAVGLFASPGTEVVVEADAHLVRYEQGGTSALWGAQLRLIVAPSGVLTASLVDTAIRGGGADDPETSLIVIENTHNAAGGRVTPVDTLRAIRSRADAARLPLHIDGARLWNAAAASNVRPADLAALGTTAMVSFTKVLACPVGSCLVLPLELRDRAVRLRRRLGGGLRQSGVLCAAVHYALDHHLDRILDDHRNAAALASGLRGCAGVTPLEPDTNIVMLDLDHDAADAARELAASDVAVSVVGPRRLRAVTHPDVDGHAVSRAVEIIERVLTGAVA